MFCLSVPASAVQRMGSESEKQTLSTISLSFILLHSFGANSPAQSNRRENNLMNVMQKRPKSNVCKNNGIALSELLCHFFVVVSLMLLLFARAHCAFAQQQQQQRIVNMWPSEKRTFSTFPQGNF